MPKMQTQTQLLKHPVEDTEPTIHIIEMIEDQKDLRYGE